MSKNKLIVLIIILISLLAVGCSNDNEEPNFYNLYGTTYNASSQSSLDGVECTITSSSEEKTVVSNSEGVFKVKELEEGTYTVKANKENFKPVEKRVELDKDTNLKISLFSKNIATLEGNVKVYNSETAYDLSSEVNFDNQVNYQSKTFDIDNSREYKESEIILKHRFDHQDQLDDLAGQYNLTKIKEISDNTVHYNTNGQSIEEMIDKLEKVDKITWVEPNYISKLTTVPSDPYYNLDDLLGKWPHLSLNLEAAWEVKQESSDFTIAVIDSGVDRTHPDLIDNIDFEREYDFIDGDDTANDENGHGTHVAGIIGAVADNNEGVAGVSWRANILPLKAFGSSGETSSTVIVEALDYAINHNVDVINMSLGTQEFSQMIEDKVQKAVANDIIVVAASGNQGSSTVEYPAHSNATIAVGATNYLNQRANYSNYGENLDIMAPGGSSTMRILSTYPEHFGQSYVKGSGTSMATPYVSGIVGLLLANGVEKDVDVVRNRLQNTAIPPSQLEAGADSLKYGAGLIDAYGALLGHKLENPKVFLAEKKNDTLYYKTPVTTVTDSGSFKLTPDQDLDNVHLVVWRDVTEDGKVSGGDYFGISDQSFSVKTGEQYSKSVNATYLSRANYQVKYEVKQGD